MVIAYGCCVSSSDKVRQNVESRVTGRLLTVRDSSSITVAYNDIIKIARGINDLEALVLLHDDLEITDVNFEAKVREALAPSNVELAGVIGARDVRSLAWWNYAPIGHQVTDTTNIDFGVRSGDVEALDGSILLLSRWTVEHLLFATVYDNFHGYDCDITRTVLALGKRAVVADIDTHHHTTLGWKSQQVHDFWLKSDEIFRRKWKL